jgi:hypothetical protein
VLGRILSKRSFLSEASEAYTAASAPVVAAASEPLTWRRIAELINKVMELSSGN